MEEARRDSPLEHPCFQTLASSTESKLLLLSAIHFVVICTAALGTNIHGNMYEESKRGMR